MSHTAIIMFPEESYFLYAGGIELTQIIFMGYFLLHNQTAPSSARCLGAISSATSPTLVVIGPVWRLQVRRPRIWTTTVTSMVSVDQSVCR